MEKLVRVRWKKDYDDGDRKRKHPSDDEEEKTSLTDAQGRHNDRDNNDIQSNGREANVRIMEEERNLLEKLYVLTTQERDLLKKLSIVRRKQADNDGDRKRKHSSDNEDMKPSASKP